MANKQAKELLNQEMQREVARKQQQIIQRYRKRLNGKKMTDLQNFVESGKQVGSSHFLKLNPVVQEVVLQLNLSGLEVMSKHNKNPFRKLQIMFSRFMMKRMKPSGKKKKGAAKGSKKSSKGKKGTTAQATSLLSTKNIIAIASAVAVVGLAIYFIAF